MKTFKSFLWWLLAIIFTVVFVIYQRISGPTYPMRGSVKINNQEVRYKMIRSAENDADAKVSIKIADSSVKGEIIFKRFKSHDSLTTTALLRKGDELYFMLPKQPAAGKMEYKLRLFTDKESVNISAKDNDPIVMRFKGPVPRFILFPHILIIFLAFLFSTRTVIEALRKGSTTYRLSVYTVALLILGGLILGPIMQKYAFDAFWTGWPFGHDLTDNKTFVAVVLWIIAMFKLKKDPTNKTWPLIAGIGTLIVFLIPHSVLGSEIDHTKVGN